MKDLNFNGRPYYNFGSKRARKIVPLDKRSNYELPLTDAMHTPNNHELMKPKHLTMTLIINTKLMKNYDKIKFIEIIEKIYIVLRLTLKTVWEEVRTVGRGRNPSAFA